MNLETTDLKLTTEKFPEELFGLRRNLRTLDMSNNRIEELPDDVGVLQVLRTLKIDDNKLGNQLTEWQIVIVICVGY